MVSVGKTIGSNARGGQKPIMDRSGVQAVGFLQRPPPLVVCLALERTDELPVQVRASWPLACHGSPRWAFLAAVPIIVVWAALGPRYRFSDTWQLVINTGTTIVTFLMVFVIQNTQNRDARAVNLKLDELLRAVKGARTGLVQLEEQTEEQLAALTKEFHSVQARAAARSEKQAPALEHGLPPDTTS
jgi:low affinity Fe/Cu permease